MAHSGMKLVNAWENAVSSFVLPESFLLGKEVSNILTREILSKKTFSGKKTNNDKLCRSYVL